MYRCGAIAARQRRRSAGAEREWLDAAPPCRPTHRSRRQRDRRLARAASTDYTFAHRGGSADDGHESPRQERRPIHSRRAAAVGDALARLTPTPMPKRLRYQVAVSLDGFIAGPKGEYDWLVMDPAVDFAALYKQFDTAVMGRKTYEAGLAAGSNGTIPGLDVLVFSRTLPPATHPGVRIVN